MNRNQLKLFACLTMLIDHIGYFILPQITVLRCIGRLAMPVFAFFIGEGCIYTSNRKKYFLSLFILASACQVVYVIEDIVTAGKLTLSSDCWYFNIIFTFAFSALAGFFLNDTTSALKEKKNFIRPALFFIIITAVFCGLTIYFSYLETQGSSLYFDYGICGFLLPLSVIPFRDNKYLKIGAFSVMLIIYCLDFMRSMPYVWFALLTIPLFIIYNGRPGSKKFKYFFYIFYPAHLGAVYLLSMLIS